MLCGLLLDEPTLRHKSTKPVSDMHIVTLMKSRASLCCGTNSEGSFALISYCSDEHVQDMKSLGEILSANFDAFLTETGCRGSGRNLWGSFQLMKSLMRK